MHIQQRKLKNWKLLCFALILCLQGALLQGQSFRESEFNKRIYTVNYATVFSGDGDNWGFGNSISHMKTVGKRVFIRQNVASWLVNGNSWINGGFENQGAIDLSAEIGIVPLKTGKRILAFTGGLCGAYIQYTSPNYGGTWSVYDFNREEYRYIQAYNQGYLNALDFGVMFGLSYYRQLTDAFYLNFRADFRSHFIDGSAISMIGVGIGFDSRKLFNQARNETN